MSIYEIAENIKTRGEFETFLKVLRVNYSDLREEWANDNLDSFLEGLYGYNYNSDNRDEASWKLFAEILLAARVYE